MTKKIDHEAIAQLIAFPGNDGFSTDLIVKCLNSFEEYHRAVYDLEITRRLFQPVTEAGEFREKIRSLDGTRTICHNSLIMNVRVLNRMAEKNGLPLIYDGVISEERPYRRELADAVFDYVERLIKERA